VLLVLSLALASCAGPLRRNYVQETKVEIERLDPFMGDWQGTSTSHNGTKSPLAAQVIALGDGKYQANLLTEFDKRIEPVDMLEGQARKDGTVQFRARSEKDEIRSTANGAIEDGKFRGQLDGMVGTSFLMHKVFRLSPTLGAKPPAKAIVLFNGKNFNEWKRAGNKPSRVQWKLVDRAMEVKPGTGSIITKKGFADIRLHLEFRTPFMPKARGQGRGNSGVYLQGRYEVQVLDSYGLEGRANECGGIYGVGPPLVNMCAPPMQWQTYDITYRVPRFDSTGKRIQEARMTVIHNGVKIQDNRKVSKATTAAPGGDITQRGGIYLQDHGNAVQYRNIWLVELPEERASR